uniref:Uncharacterized protein n=1 Tax=Lepeophtheirus salmonis TaxID=72036 RepID=A0A0K2VGM0_LEPSM
MTQHLSRENVLILQVLVESQVMYKSLNILYKSLNIFIESSDAIQAHFKSIIIIQSS